MVHISTFLSDSSRGIEVDSPRDYIKLSRKGLSFRQLKEILEYTNISLEQLGGIISLSNKEMTKYSDNEILRTDVSAHLIQIVELYKKGYEVLESKDNFQTWMNSEIRVLEYQKPVDLLDTPFGLQDVINVLGRLEHGVYS